MEFTKICLFRNRRNINVLLTTYLRVLQELTLFYIRKNILKTINIKSNFLAGVRLASAVCGSKHFVSCCLGNIIFVTQHQEFELFIQMRRGYLHKIN